ncbi:unnamed protein product [Closterium sp. Naga37s-1]|nr:unnamed protein product [Closterium sp. Naga37s-1]
MQEVKHERQLCHAAANLRQVHPTGLAPRLRSRSRGRFQAPADAAGMKGAQDGGGRGNRKTQQMSEGQGRTSRKERGGDENAGNSQIRTEPQGGETPAQGGAGAEAHEVREQGKEAHGGQEEQPPPHPTEVGTNTQTAQQESVPTRAAREAEQTVEGVAAPRLALGPTSGDAPARQPEVRNRAEAAEGRGQKDKSAEATPTPALEGEAAAEELAAQTALAQLASPSEMMRTGTGPEGAATAGTVWQAHGAEGEDEPGRTVAGEGDDGGGKNGRVHGETDECAHAGSGTQAPLVEQACSAAQKTRRQHPQSGSPRRLGTGLAPARPGPLVGWAQQEIPPPRSLHAEAAGAYPSSGMGNEADRPHERAERAEAEAENGAAVVEEEQVTVIDRCREGTARQRLLRERAAEAAAGNPPAGTRGQAPVVGRGRGGRGARGRGGRGGLAAAVAREKARSGPWRERHGRPERQQGGGPMNDCEDDGDEEYMEEEQGDSEDVSLEDEQGIPAGGTNRGTRVEGNRADANEGESRGAQPSETASKARSPADIANDPDPKSRRFRETAGLWLRSDFSNFKKKNGRCSSRKPASFPRTPSRADTNQTRKACVPEQRA